ncbi:MAG: GntR family transcriptional regulator [Sphingomonas sp.]
MPIDESVLNASEEAYQQLRDRILDGTLKPGGSLIERDLCSQFGISRTPVREALRRLTADGLAEMRPRRSIIVSSFCEEELGEIFELGIVLESFVAGLAAQKASSADIGELETILADMEGLLQHRGDSESFAYAKLDQAFHDRIAQAAHNPRVSQILRQTVSLRLLANLMEHYVPRDFKVSLTQHRMIVQAIAAGDAEWAQTAMGSHIRTGRAAGRKVRVVSGE